MLTSNEVYVENLSSIMDARYVALCLFVILILHGDPTLACLCPWIFVCFAIFTYFWWHIDTEDINWKFVSTLVFPLQTEYSILMHIWWLFYSNQNQVCLSSTNVWIYFLQKLVGSLLNHIHSALVLCARRIVTWKVNSLMVHM